MKSLEKIGVACVFIWIGFVLSISFMEAWLKFQAPGITTALGLGIGRLVFAALNSVELVLAGIILIIFLTKAKRNTENIIAIMLYLPLAILLLQTFWLLPA